MMLFSPLLPGWRKLALVCALSSCLPALAFAQASNKANAPVAPAKVDVRVHGMNADQLDEQLKSRNRTVIHPGEPLRVVGLEEGDNGFRDRTPLLENAEGMASAVDLKELRERRLAMYTTGANFHTPVARQTQWDETGNEGPPTTRPEGKLLETIEELGSNNLIGGLLLVGVAAGVAAVVLQGRS